MKLLLGFVCLIVLCFVGLKALVFLGRTTFDHPWIATGLALAGLMYFGRDEKPKDESGSPVTVSKGK